MAIAGYNHVTSLGSISGGPWHNPATKGRAESCAMTLAIPEPSRTGEIYNTYARVECYGRTVPDALDQHAGDVVLVDGKLSWSKGSGKSTAALAVTAWRGLKLASKLPTTG